MLLLVAAMTAQAQTETCSQTFSRLQLALTIGQVTDALADQDLPDARERLNEAADRLPCMDEVVDRTLYAKFARYMAMAFYFADDVAAAKRWGVSSRLADPELSWDEEQYPPGHPLRAMIRDTEVPAMESADGQGLAPPRGGGVFMSGSLLQTPEAPTGIPGLIQVFDVDQRPVDGWWQEGSLFPADVLTPRPKPIEAPWWWKGDGPTSALARPKLDVTQPHEGTGQGGRRIRKTRDRPVPVAPIAGTGALLVTSGVTYLLADNAARSLPDQTSAEALASTRTRANLLVLASGLSLAGAIGVGVGGVVFQGNGVTIRF
ncbi:MAG: hypothetical protein KTR31_40770 [Myxococcales bacterium]|nr:hypothetical protein [Myxococcales bacterium]